MSKRNNRALHKNFFSVVSMTCRSPLIHVEVDSKFQPLLYQEYLLILTRLELQTSPNLDSTRVALHHSGDVSTRTSHNQIKAPPQSSWWDHRFHFSKPSRRRQPPRVTSWWCLLKDSLVLQSSNTWCNALGCSHTLKNATTKQCEWERGENLL